MLELRVDHRRWTVTRGPVVSGHRLQRLYLVHAHDPTQEVPIVRRQLTSLRALEPLIPCRKVQRGLAGPPVQPHVRPGPLHPREIVERVVLSWEDVAILYREALHHGDRAVANSIVDPI